MSIVIVGGNDRMVKDYKDLCKKYSCKAKVFTQMSGTMREQFGDPDLLILLTNTVSHKMVKCAMCQARKKCTKVCHIHSSSLTALDQALEENVNP